MRTETVLGTASSVLIVAALLKLIDKNGMVKEGRLPLMKTTSLGWDERFTKMKPVAPAVIALLSLVLIEQAPPPESGSRSTRTNLPAAPVKEAAVQPDAGFGLKQIVCGVEGLWSERCGSGEPFSRGVVRTQNINVPDGVRVEHKHLHPGRRSIGKSHRVRRIASAYVLSFGANAVVFNAAATKVRGLRVAGRLVKSGFIKPVVQKIDVVEQLLNTGLACFCQRRIGVGNLGVQELTWRA